MIDCGCSAQCHGKAQFASARLALEVTRRQAAQRKRRKRARREDGVPSEVYRCTHCGHWHLGRPLTAERR